MSINANNDHTELAELDAREPRWHTPAGARFLSRLAPGETSPWTTATDETIADRLISAGIEVPRRNRRFFLEIDTVPATIFETWDNPGLWIFPKTARHRAAGIVASFEAFLKAGGKLKRARHLVLRAARELSTPVDLQGAVRGLSAAYDAMMKTEGREGRIKPLFSGVHIPWSESGGGFDVHLHVICEIDDDRLVEVQASLARRFATSHVEQVVRKPAALVNYIASNAVNHSQLLNAPDSAVIAVHGMQRSRLHRPAGRFADFRHGCRTEAPSSVEDTPGAGAGAAMPVRGASLAAIQVSFQGRRQWLRVNEMPDDDISCTNLGSIPDQKILTPVGFYPKDTDLELGTGRQDESISELGDTALAVKAEGIEPPAYLTAKAFAGLGFRPALRIGSVGGSISKDWSEVGVARPVASAGTESAPSPEKSGLDASVSSRPYMHGIVYRPAAGHNGAKPISKVTAAPKLERLRDRQEHASEDAGSLTAGIESRPEPKQKTARGFGGPAASNVPPSRSGRYATGRLGFRPMLPNTPVGQGRTTPPVGKVHTSEPVPTSLRRYKKRASVVTSVGCQAPTAPMTCACARSEHHLSLTWQGITIDIRTNDRASNCLERDPLNPVHYLAECRCA